MHYKRDSEFQRRRVYATYLSIGHHAATMRSSVAFVYWAPFFAHTFLLLLLLFFLFVFFFAIVLHACVVCASFSPCFCVAQHNFVAEKSEPASFGPYMRPRQTKTKQKTHTNSTHTHTLIIFYLLWIYLCCGRWKRTDIIQLIRCVVFVIRNWSCKTYTWLILDFVQLCVACSILALYWIRW